MMEAAKQNCGGQCDIVFVGDSITEALIGQHCYYAKPQEEERAAVMKAIPHEWRTLILAGGGDQTQHTLKKLEIFLPVLNNPRIFFVMIGTNNIGFTGGFNASETSAGVRTVVTAIREAHPDAQVLLHPILPRAQSAPDFRHMQATIDEANGEIQAFALAAAPDVQYTDCNAVFPRGDTAEAHALMPDLLHPNAEGYRRWFACLVPKFKQSLSDLASA
eukprot:gnl/TRDRNA2_/TRDRNA2_44283_c0_seq1.p1 gnl/TRDRNA2_/TRDRNA2_44283_c0~~gnl/TRDRNA2_/TRDRNA2_44283_c0_seq1.p1  ORF type:complete len:239 (+),score=28.59 gnl/TRDRNA2_/TRDRNA2_44283_c0_seq1:64-717(+)